jgi:hypothetical protein
MVLEKCLALVVPSDGRSGDNNRSMFLTFGRGTEIFHLFCLLDDFVLQKSLMLEYDRHLSQLLPLSIVKR